MMSEIKSHLVFLIWDSDGSTGSIVPLQNETHITEALVGAICIDTLLVTVAPFLAFILICKYLKRFITSDPMGFT